MRKAGAIKLTLAPAYLVTFHDTRESNTFRSVIVTPNGNGVCTQVHATSSRYRWRNGFLHDTFLLWLLHLNVCSQWDSHKIPPSHPERRNPIPARPPMLYFYFSANAYFLSSSKFCLDPLAFILFSPFSLSHSYFDLFLSFFLSTRCCNQGQRTSSYVSPKARRRRRYGNDDVDEKRPWFHPPVPSAHCFPPNPVRPAPLSGLLKERINFFSINYRITWNIGDLTISPIFLRLVLQKVATFTVAHGSVILYWSIKCTYSQITNNNF